MIWKSAKRSAISRKARRSIMTCSSRIISNSSARSAGCRGRALASRIDEMFQVCGLTKMAARPIGNLSKGFRQRVGLAQAMLADPQLLILDEPTSGLDPNQIIEIRQLIKNMGKEKTVIYCSHILSEVSATCNHIIIINQGSIVASGTADELTAKMNKENRYVLRLKADRTVGRIETQNA